MILITRKEVPTKSVMSKKLRENVNICVNRCVIYFKSFHLN